MTKRLLLVLTMLVSGCAANTDEIADPTSPSAPSDPSSASGEAQRPDARATGAVALPGLYEEKTQFRVYVAGGDGSADVWSAPIANGGELGKWRAERALPSKQAVTLFHGGRSELLALGPDGKILSSIEGPTGITSWREVGRVDASRGAGVATNGSSLLVIGGELDLGLRRETFATTLDNGMPGAFSAATPLPTGRASFGATRLGPYVFAAGGLTSEGLTNEVLVGRPSKAGDIAAWQRSVDLPKAVREQVLATQGDALFSIGGKSDVAEDSVFVSHMADDGAISAWSRATSLPSGRYGHCVVVSGATMLVFGGFDAQGAVADVLSTTVQANGSLAPWRTLGKMPDARGHLGCAVR